MDIIVDSDILTSFNVASINEFLVLNNVFNAEDESHNYIKSIMNNAFIGLAPIRGSFEKLFNDKGIRNSLIEDLMDLWYDSFSEVEQMTNLLNRLIFNHKVNITIFGNICYEHHFKLMNMFNNVFRDCNNHFSFEVGAKMPSKLFYQSFILSNINMKGCRYYTSHKNNIKHSRASGILPYNFNLNDYVSFEDAATSLEVKILA